MPDEPGLFEVMYTTRAMRRLKPDAVPEDLLRRLIDAAHQAPSGSNAQNARWIVVRAAEQKAAIAALNRAAVERYIAAARGPGEHFPEAKRQRMLAALAWQAEHLHEVPALVFACLDLGGAPSERFWVGAGAAGSVWPGVQNLLLAARALGLGATPTTLVFSDREAVNRILALPERIQAFCMIPVGYPLGRFGPVTRRPLDDVLRWDRWS